MLLGVVSNTRASQVRWPGDLLRREGKQRRSQIYLLPEKVWHIFELKELEEAGGFLAIVALSGGHKTHTHTQKMLY